MSDPTTPEPSGSRSIIDIYRDATKNHQIALRKDKTTTLRLKPARPVSMAEVPGAAFRAGSAALQAGAADGSGSPLPAIAAALIHAKERREERLLVAAHGPDAELSARRAEVALRFVRADRDGFAAASHEAATVFDWQQALQWVAAVRGWPCDPGDVDGKVGPRTRGALAECRKRWAAAFERPAPQGDISAADWAMFFDLYDAALAQLMDEPRGPLAARRAALPLAARPAVGCAGAWPPPSCKIQQHLITQAERVDLLFFAEADVPKLDCHAPGGDATVCDVYRKQKYRAMPLATAPAPVGPMRVRLLGLLFETDKTFLLPGSLRAIKALKRLHDKRPPGEVLVVGHTDTAGARDWNLTLSERRAEAVGAYLRDEVEPWVAWYGQDRHEKQRWGVREDKHMLAHRRGDDGLPFYGGDLDSKVDPGYTGAVMRFQAWSNARQGTALKEDGKGTADTRRALVRAYMSEDGTTLPKETSVVTHGCGEHHPAVETGDEQANEENRRVEVFLFSGAATPPPSKCPSPAGCGEYAAWVAATTETIDLRQELSSLEVLVKDDAGALLEGVKVSLDGPGADSAATGADGVARFEGELPGAYVVTAGLEGHVDARGQVTIGGGPARTELTLLAHVAQVVLPRGPSTRPIPDYVLRSRDRTFERRLGRADVKALDGEPLLEFRRVATGKVLDLFEVGATGGELPIPLLSTHEAPVLAAKADDAGPAPSAAKARQVAGTAKLTDGAGGDRGPSTKDGVGDANGQPLRNNVGLFVRMSEPFKLMGLDVPLERKTFERTGKPNEETWRPVAFHPDRPELADLPRPSFVYAIGLIGGGPRLENPYASDLERRVLYEIELRGAGAFARPVVRRPMSVFGKLFGGPNEVESEEDEITLPVQVLERNAEGVVTVGSLRYAFFSCGVKLVEAEQDALAQRLVQFLLPPVLLELKTTPYNGRLDLAGHLYNVQHKGRTVRAAGVVDMGIAGLAAGRDYRVKADKAIGHCHKHDRQTGAEAKETELRQRQRFLASMLSSALTTDLRNSCLETPSAIEDFVKEDDRRRRSLIEDREQAAARLVTLRTGTLGAIWREAVRRVRGDAVVAYLELGSSMVERLGDSPIGQAGLLKELDAKGSVFKEFILPDPGMTSEDQFKISYKAAPAIFGLLPELAKAVLAAKRPVDLLLRVNAALRFQLLTKGVMQLEKLSVALSTGTKVIPARAQTFLKLDQAATVFAHFKIKDFEALKVRTTLGLEVVNLLLAVDTLTKAEPGLARAKEIGNLAGAVVNTMAAMRTIMGIPAEEALAKALERKLKALGAVGAILDAGCALYDVVDLASRDDYDAAVASMGIVIGSGLTAAGCVCVTLGFGAAPVPIIGLPVALALELAGAVLVAAGTIAVVLTTDSQMETFLKHCAWGNRKGKGSDAPRWAGSKPLADLHTDFERQLEAAFALLSGFLLESRGSQGFTARITLGHVPAGAVLHVEGNIEGMFRPRMKIKLDDKSVVFEGKPTIDPANIVHGTEGGRRFVEVTFVKAGRKLAPTDVSTESHVIVQLELDDALERTRRQIPAKGPHIFQFWGLQNPGPLLRAFDPEHSSSW